MFTILIFITCYIFSNVLIIPSKQSAKLSLNLASLSNSSDNTVLPKSYSYPKSVQLGTIRGARARGFLAPTNYIIDFLYLCINFL